MAYSMRYALFPRRILFCCIPALFVLQAARAPAEVQPVAHYRVGDSGGGIAFTPLANTVKNLAGDSGHLAKIGLPMFVPSAPDLPTAKRKGAALFKGKADGFAFREKILADPSCFVFEAWVLAARSDAPGVHAAAALGNGAAGYVLIQEGDQWKLLIGSVGTRPFGKVRENVWTHLAVVHSGQTCTLYMDGKKTIDGGAGYSFNPGISVGCSIFKDKPQEFFDGMVYEVRLSAFQQGKFDPFADFLLNDKTMAAQRELSIAERRARLDSIQSNHRRFHKVAKIELKKKTKDWLIDPIDQKAEVFYAPDSQAGSATLTLSNGLVARTFFVGDNLVCFSLKNLSTDQECLRSIKPEANLQINGTWYAVGGMIGVPQTAYFLERWLPELQSSPNAFTFDRLEVTDTKEHYPWKPFHKKNIGNYPWPHPGVRAIFHYKPPQTASDDIKNLSIKIYYEMFDGAPMMAKWFTVENCGKAVVTVNRLESELLAMNEAHVNRIHVESNYSFDRVNADQSHLNWGSESLQSIVDPPPYASGKTTTHIVTDLDYFIRPYPCCIENKGRRDSYRNLLKSTIPFGPEQDVQPGQEFRSMITYEILLTDDEWLRQSLERRQLYRRLAPQVNESFLVMGVYKDDEKLVKDAIDQAAEFDFDILDLASGTGFDYRNIAPEYVARWKKVFDYARTKNMVVSAYEMIVAMNRRGPDVDCVQPPAGFVMDGGCVATDFFEDYFFNRMIGTWADKAGMGAFMLDGPYHGAPCASTKHQHKGLENSQWAQWSAYCRFMDAQLERRMPIIIPDWYIFNGANAVPLGHNEGYGAISKEEELLILRQNIYDGTIVKPPTMGYVCIDIIGTYGTNKKAMLLPLKDHLPLYEKFLFQELGSGALVTFRSMELYDSPETKAMVKKWFDWYKKYRDIITSDVIHVDRPTGRDIDIIYHVNPRLKICGLVLAFNPTQREISKNLRIPVYYAGIKNSARIQREGGAGRAYPANRDYDVFVPIALKPESFTWLLIQNNDAAASALRD